MLNASDTPSRAPAVTGVAPAGRERPAPPAPTAREEVAVVGDGGFPLHAIAVMLADEGGFAVRELHRGDGDVGGVLRRSGTAAALLALDRGAPEALALQVRDIAAAAPGTALVAILHGADPVLARDVLDAGARGCLTVVATTAELFEAVSRVLDGEQYVSPVLALAFVRFGETNGPADLTQREREVLRLLALGFTNREIGRAMHLSVRTIETHRSRVQGKLGTSRRADLVRHAVAAGLLG